MAKAIVIRPPPGGGISFGNTGDHPSHKLSKSKSESGPYMKLSESMSKTVYVIGIVLLWLVAGIGVVWWAFTTFAVFEVQWAVLVTAVFLIVVLFASLVLSRMWRWIWLSSNPRESDD